MTPQITKTPKFEKAGDNITMVCQSNGSVTMKWIKKNRTLQSNDAPFNQHGLLVTRKILEVRNFSKQDEGIYKCQVAAIKFNWSNSKTIAIKFRGKIFRSSFLNIRCHLSYNRAIDMLANVWVLNNIAGSHNFVTFNL